jgi:hypothetical protein
MYVCMYVCISFPVNYFILTFDFIPFGKTGAQYTQFGVVYG